MALSLPGACRQWLYAKWNALKPKRYRTQPSLQKQNTDSTVTLANSKSEKAIQTVDEKFLSPAFTEQMSSVLEETTIAPISVMALAGLPTSDPMPTTAEEFQHAITAAQRFKEDCAIAEDAAEREAHRRFQDYQDMYYLEKAIQEQSEAAQATLYHLVKSAREAGFISPSEDDCMESEAGHSQDAIRRFIDRLERPKE